MVTGCPGRGGVRVVVVVVVVREMFGGVGKLWQ